jgi:hypothetical protein
VVEAQGDPQVVFLPRQLFCDLTEQFIWSERAALLVPRDARKWHCAERVEIGIALPYSSSPRSYRACDMRCWKCLSDERECGSGEQEITQVVGAYDEDAADLSWTPGLPVADGCASVHRTYQHLAGQKLTSI